MWILNFLVKEISDLTSSPAPPFSSSSFVSFFFPLSTPSDSLPVLFHAHGFHSFSLPSPPPKHTHTHIPLHENSLSLFSLSLSFSFFFFFDAAADNGFIVASLASGPVIERVPKAGSARVGPSTSSSRVCRPRRPPLALQVRRRRSLDTVVTSSC